MSVYSVDGLGGNAESLSSKGCSFYFTLCDFFFIYWAGEGNLQPGFFRSPCRTKLAHNALEGIETILSFLPQGDPSKRDSASHMLILILCEAFRSFDARTSGTFAQLIADPLAYNGGVPLEKVSSVTTQLTQLVELYHRCDNCHDCGNMAGVSLKSCARCNSAKYCGSACQREDWAFHKKVCKAPGAVVVPRPRTSKDQIDSDVDD